MGKDFTNAKKCLVLRPKDMISDEYDTLRSYLEEICPDLIQKLAFLKRSNMQFPIS